MKLEKIAMCQTRFCGNITLFKNEDDVITISLDKDLCEDILEEDWFEICGSVNALLENKHTLIKGKGGLDG